MLITWHKISISSLRIDDKLYNLSNTDYLDIPLRNGEHSIEILVSPYSASNFRTKILLNWLSYFCGAFEYSIDNAFADTYDTKIAFNWTIDSIDEKIDLNALIHSHNGEIGFDRTKQINRQRLKIVKRMLLLPLGLFGGILSGVFLMLGIISVQDKNVGIGIFAVVISVLGAASAVGLSIKAGNQIKNLTKDN